MYNSNAGPVYPSAPLETEIEHDHQPILPPPAMPPTYAQATGTMLNYPHVPTYGNNTTPVHMKRPAHPPPPPPVQQIPTPAAAPQIVVITQQPTSPMLARPLPCGPRSMDMQCPFCHNYVRTRIRHSPNSRTHLIAFVMCLLQLYCCACLPYCIGSCMNTVHYCGICDRYLGTYEPVTNSCI